MSILDWGIRWLHAIAGAVTLLAMIVPLVTRKGGRTHRRAGWVFVGCLTYLCLSSAWLCVTALLAVPGESVTGRGNMSQEFGAFLLFVTLLTGNAVFSGLAVLRRKKRTAPLGFSLDVAFASVVGLSAVGLGIWGLVEGNAIFLGFAVLGILGAGRELRMLRGSPTDKHYWWYVHMNGMIGGCIGTLTAFLVINSEQMVDGATSGVPEWLFWLAPSLLGVPTLITWRRRYRRQFDG